MTLVEFKEVLPDVKVKIDGHIYENCLTGGRKNRFCGVTVYGSPPIRFEVAWETALRCYETNTPIKYQ